MRKARAKKFTTTPTLGQTTPILHDRDEFLGEKLNYKLSSGAAELGEVSEPDPIESTAEVASKLFC